MPEETSRWEIMFTTKVSQVFPSGLLELWALDGQLIVDGIKQKHTKGDTKGSLNGNTNHQHVTYVKSSNLSPFSPKVKLVINYQFMIFVTVYYVKNFE